MLRELHLFAGGGGGILGGMLLGHHPVCAVEIEPYCRDILLQRQRDGIMPWFPIWDDVRTFDGRDWQGRVDIVCGGFPCQDISVAGKGAGIDGERSGLWSEMARIIREVAPQYIFVENSPALTARGLGRVLGDLAEMGYDCRWGCVSAEDAIWLGGPPAMDHLRERIWILGVNRIQRGRQKKTEQTRLGSGITQSSDASRIQQGRQEQRAERERTWASSEHSCQFCGHPFDIESLGKYGCPNCHGEGLDDASANSSGSGCEELDTASESIGTRFCSRFHDPGRSDWWITEPELGRVAHGVANRVDRLKAIGNGQVPAVAALAWQLLSQLSD